MNKKTGCMILIFFQTDLMFRAYHIYNILYPVTSTSSFLLNYEVARDFWYHIIIRVVDTLKWPKYQ